MICDNVKKSVSQDSQNFKINLNVNQHSNLPLVPQRGDLNKHFVRTVMDLLTMSLQNNNVTRRNTNCFLRKRSYQRQTIKKFFIQRQKKNTIKLIHATVLFLYSLKTSENQGFSIRKPGVFRCFHGTQKETSGMKCVNFKSFGFCTYI